ncbi:lysosomal alpha-mannosidase-like isoform X2 [Rhodnius prolixus]
MNIQEAGVQYIIDSVIEALLENPQRRFIYVETAFFWMWWVEQTHEKKQVVRELVNSGRLEIVGGAWSMNDEAAAHYHSIIDQFTWGFRRLKESLGECGTPKIGWQIDPFGHSRENAAIMAKMGFDGLFLGRIDYQDKVTRNYNRAFEMLWHTSENDMSDASSLFTCILYNTYSPPNGFCFDVHCNDSPIVDNMNSPEYNVPERVSTFLNLMLEYHVPYRSGNILVTMGNDFNYQYAGMNYKNMDKLIKYINEYEFYGSKFHAFYSTPSCYLKAVNEAGVRLPTKSDDFFPYSSDPESFWTGYFTSRPTHKRFERMGNNFLQVGKQILALSNSPSSIDITEAKEAMGVLQHHDSITGTEKAHVANDYARILTAALKTVETATSFGLNVLIKNDVMQKWLVSDSLKFTSCLLLNISSCPETETARSFVITIYNPLSRFVDKLVRFPVANTQLIYNIRGPGGENVPAQLVPLPDFISIPGRESNASVEIAFIAKNIPPLGFISYYVESSKVKSSDFYSSEVSELLEEVKLGYENGTTISLSAEGRITALSKKLHSKEIPFHQNFFYYRGAVGNNDLHLGGERSSGAYIFRPNGTVVPINNKPITRIVKGPIVTEIQQKFSEWVSQVIRLQNGKDYIEFQWTVGPIPFQEGLEKPCGKEVITRYTMSTLHNNRIFYTDSNGREMLKRQINYRPTWEVELFEPVSGNYYPVTTRINIKDVNNPSQTLSVITDRSEGGSSLNDGEIELMLHRRLMHDDAFGVGEALDEIAFEKPLVAIGSHYVSLSRDANARMLVQEKVLDSWTFISSTQGLSFEKWKKEYKMEFSGIKSALPNNVQILTLERWEQAEDEKKIYLLRLENIMDKRADPSVAEVNIQDLFTTFSIINIKEMMLGGNIPSDRSRRLKWRSFNKRNGNIKVQEASFVGNIVTLKPMEIRTFLIKVEPSLLSSFIGQKPEAILI